MKNIIVQIVIIILITSCYTFAWDSQKNYRNKNSNNSWCNCEYMGAPDSKVQITQDEAKLRVQNRISDLNLKGYTVGEIKEETNPKGMKIFIANVTDAGGNIFEFIVSPYGQVKGPMNTNYKR